MYSPTQTARTLCQRCHNLCGIESETCAQCGARLCIPQAMRFTMEQPCARCKKRADPKNMVIYGGYLWDRVCLIKQIYQHVQNQERRDELLEPYNFTSEEYSSALGTPVVVPNAHVY